MAYKALDSLPCPHHQYLQSHFLPFSPVTPNPSYRNDLFSFLCAHGLGIFLQQANLYLTTQFKCTILCEIFLGNSPERGSPSQHPRITLRAPLHGTDTAHFWQVLLECLLCAVLGLEPSRKQNRHNSCPMEIYIAAETKGPQISKEVWSALEVDKCYGQKQSGTECSRPFIVQLFASISIQVCKLLEGRDHEYVDLASPLLAPWACGGGLLNNECPFDGQKLKSA